MLPAEGVGLCAKCRSACFCSRACAQRAASNAAGHPAAVCSALARLDFSGLSADACSALRYLAQANALRASSLAGDADAAARWGALGCLADGLGGPAQADAAELHRRLAAATPVGSPYLTEAEAGGALAAEARCGYGVMAPCGRGGERRLRGTGLYPAAALLNHEALHALPAGEELTCAYFPLHLSLEERQARCREQYGFACACPRCAEEATWQGEDETVDLEASSLEGGVASEEGMDEEADPAVDPGGGPAAGAGLPRADPAYIQMFLLKYTCPQPECFGTVAPRPGGDPLECSLCGFTRSEAAFLAELEATSD
ncbi:hypothetical protein WJX81_002808 [Elliptochloris bilobata]|uniref:SET domain-containing protein n=1 Tax=Elliptochloris bilobata TaxID=381761 RepID=A0AAW1SHJ2_9CHLO